MQRFCCEKALTKTFPDIVYGKLARMKHIIGIKNDNHAIRPTESHMTENNDNMKTSDIIFSIASKSTALLN